MQPKDHSGCKNLDPRASISHNTHLCELEEDPLPAWIVGGCHDGAQHKALLGRGAALVPPLCFCSLLRGWQLWVHGVRMQAHVSFWCTQCGFHVTGVGRCHCSSANIAMNLHSSLIRPLAQVVHGHLWQRASWDRGGSASSTAASADSRWR